MLKPKRNEAHSPYLEGIDFHKVYLHHSFVGPRGVMSLYFSATNEATIIAFGQGTTAFDVSSIL